MFAVAARRRSRRYEPYAAGSPFGGIPLWNPGDKFVAVAGGGCSGTCPVYELYVFDDGRVVFLGQEVHRQDRRVQKQIGREAYAELLTLIVHTGVLDKPRSSAAPA